MTQKIRSSIISITVLSIKPVKLGRMFALASVEIDIDGLVLVLHGVRALRLQPIGTLIDLPMFRDENGVGGMPSRYPTRFPGQLAKPCSTNLSRAVWPSEVPYHEGQSVIRSVPRPCKSPADVIASKMAGPPRPGSLAINPMITGRMRAFTRQARRL